MPRVQETNTRYGATNFYTSSAYDMNLMFVNGIEDPWKTASYTDLSS